MKKPIQQLMKAVFVTTALAIGSSAVGLETATALSFNTSNEVNETKQSLEGSSETLLAHQLQGEASWYGPNFKGQTTANGETFNPSQMTAAHRTLPLGTRVRVTNQRNNQSVVVRINDRGPYAGGRVIDLSRAAAEAIGMRGSGVAPVSIQVIE